eukprot:m.153467 g.153467  ORF g.153467 m.153467 type:complete len:161 (-) comp16233_c3_seq7:54-536(-)
MSGRIDERLEANLSVNRARELKHGTPDLINHGDDRYLQSTLKSEHPPVAPAPSYSAGLRQKMREERARQQALADVLHATESSRPRTPQGPADEPIKILKSNRQDLAETLRPQQGTSYIEDEPQTFWTAKAGELPGMTKPAPGGAFRRRGDFTRPLDEQAE